MEEKDLNLKFYKDRVLFMEKEFDEVSCNILRKQMLALIADDPNSEITIYISSYGGSVYDFLQLYDIVSMKSRRWKLRTIAIGKAMSAGAYLLLLGDIRLSFEHSRIMLHELAYSTSYNKLHEQENYIEESKKLQKILANIVKRKTNIKNVEVYLKENQHMSPTEAVKLKVIDRII